MRCRKVIEVILKGLLSKLHTLTHADVVDSATLRKVASASVKDALKMFDADTLTRNIDFIEATSTNRVKLFLGWVPQRTGL